MGRGEQVGQAGRIWRVGLAGRGRIAAVAFFVILVGSPGLVAQCAMCRRALASPEGQQMIAAFRSGILILLAAPIVAFAVVARLAVRMDRTRRQSVEKEG
jgi:hypothetical protein